MTTTVDAGLDVRSMCPGMRGEVVATLQHAAPRVGDGLHTLADYLESSAGFVPTDVLDDLTDREQLFFAAALTYTPAARDDYYRLMDSKRSPR